MEIRIGVNYKAYSFKIYYKRIDGSVEHIKTSIYKQRRDKRAALSGIK